MSMLLLLDDADAKRAVPNRFCSQPRGQDLGLEDAAIERYVKYAFMLLSGTVCFSIYVRGDSFPFVNQLKKCSPTYMRRSCHVKIALIHTNQHFFPAVFVIHRIPDCLSGHEAHCVVASCPPVNLGRLHVTQET